jgi:glycerol-3-phosphate dehydrogenase
MERNLEVLTEGRFDVVVIGGGIVGVATAWDAALRGLKVALIERGDFCQGTSAYSFRMVHGGIRYLQHLDIARIRESVRERRALLRIAPHLVEPLPIAIPTYGHGMQGKAALLAGMRLYEVAAWGRNRGLRDAARQIPAGRVLSREETMRLFPFLEGSSLTGAGVFWDAQIYNPPRLALAFVQSAVARGAVAANYVEAIRVLKRNGRVVGVDAKDTLTGDELTIHGRVVVNAAGGWAPGLLAGTGAQLRPGVTFSRDACFIVRRSPIATHALALLAASRDPDAVLSREGRHLFVAPWRQCTMVGVWHKVFEGDPNTVVVSEDEILAWIAEVNRACPALKLRIDEVACYNAGLTLFGDNKPGAAHLRYGHRSRVVDHAGGDQGGIEGLITAIGVRLTVARAVAERVLTLVGRTLGRSLPPCRTEITPLASGEVPDYQAFMDQAVSRPKVPLPADVLRSLARNYGSHCGQVFELAARHPSLSERLGDSHVIGAQVVHAVRTEMAQRLGDVVYRRTDLGTAEMPSVDSLRDCAAVMAGELNWSPARGADEVALAQAEFPHPATSLRRNSASAARASMPLAALE